MTDYGTDLSLLSDLTPDMAENSGRTLLAQALVRRLTCPRGRLLDDPNYGIDLNDWLNAGFTQTDLSQKVADIDQELLKDERILASTSSAVFNTLASGVESLEVTVTVVDGSGPFNFVLNIDGVSVPLLTIG